MGSDPLHPETEAHGSSDRGFGHVFAGVAGLLTGVGLWSGHSWWPWPAAAAVVFLALARLAPQRLHPLNVVWTRFGLLLHQIMTPLVMGLLFLFVVTPVGLLMRLSGRDPMARRRDRTAASYWVRRDPPGPAPETMDRQF